MTHALVIIMLIIIIGITSYPYLSGILSSPSLSSPSSSPSSPSPSSSSPSSSPSPSPSSPSPSLSPSSAQSSLIFEGVGVPHKKLKVSSKEKKVWMGNQEGAMIYFQSTGEDGSFTAYLYVNSQLYQFKYENEPQIGILITKHSEFDTICVYRLVGKE